MLGKLLGWDKTPARAAEQSYAHRLSRADRDASLVAPGTQDGPFELLYLAPTESISEAHNATVHAFSVFALVGNGTDYRLYWAIYVKPVSGLTIWYMRLINPVRCLLIYPALLRQIRTSWAMKVSR